MTSVSGGEEVDLRADLAAESPALIVAFGGLAEELGIPAFEFMRIVESIGSRRIFLRDRRRIWYQRGVAGVGPTPDAVADGLAGLVASSGASKVVFVGSSAGAYAALLFSTLVPVHEVIAFGPQTVIDPEVRASLGDERWHKSTAALERNGGPDERYRDLRPLFERFAGDRPKVTLHYAAESRLDVAHAERLAGISGVDLQSHPGRDHNIPAALKRDGRLAALLEQGIAN